MQEHLQQGTATALEQQHRTQEPAPALKSITAQQDNASLPLSCSVSFLLTLTKIKIGEN